MGEIILDYLGASNVIARVFPRREGDERTDRMTAGNGILPSENPKGTSPPDIFILAHWK